MIKRYLKGLLLEVFWIGGILTELCLSMLLGVSLLLYTLYELILSKFMTRKNFAKNDTDKNKKIKFVNLKSNSALLYNKGHNFEKVFRPKNFLKTEYFPPKRIISLSSRTCKFLSRTCKLYFPLWIHFIEWTIMNFSSIVFCSLL